MSFKSVVLRNEKYLLRALLALVFIQTLIYSITAFKGIPASENTLVVYRTSYFLLLLYWFVARYGKLESSFDTGLFHWFILPFFIIYKSITQLGWLKGFGIVFLIYLGLALPEIAHNVILMVRFHTKI